MVMEVPSEKVTVVTPSVVLVFVTVTEAPTKGTKVA